MMVKKTERVDGGHRLRLLSYNIQTGSSTSAYGQYLTHSWKHVLPSSERFHNLSDIAHMVREYDVVGLQEVDAGSLRSGFINQTEFLANRARFPFWHHQTTRKIGKIAQHSNGFMSKFRPSEIISHKLPGVIPGRGALCVRFGNAQDSLIVVILHLALGKRSRMRQLAYVSDLARKYENVIIMGDMNCKSDSLEMKVLQKTANLREPTHDLHTFPSWRPERNIDHILVSPSLKVEKVQVLNHTYSDHLPIEMEVIVPSSIKLTA